MHSIHSIHSLTVFTPSYNRRHTLPELYKSLCCQTSQDFLWLIVDDGSTDETESLVETWIHEGKISIQYHRQPNGGKMRAHNQGVLLSHTELFVCVDSDDYLTDNAVENVLETWKSLDDKKQLAGIVAYRGKDPEHTMSGESFPHVKNATLQELYQKGYSGETALVYRTDILRQYPFPCFEGEKFIPEAVVYDQIDQHYQLHVLPEILTICEYRDDGLTHSVDLLRQKNPQGWLYYYQQKIRHTPWSVLRYKYLAHAVCFCWELNYDPFQWIPASRVEVLLGVGGAGWLRKKGRL